MLKLTDCTLKSFVVLVHHKPIICAIKLFFLMQLTKILSLIFTSLQISMQLWQFSICLHYLSPGNSGPDGMHTVNALHKLMNRRQLQVVFYLSSRVFAKSPNTKTTRRTPAPRTHRVTESIDRGGATNKRSVWTLTAHWARPRSSHWHKSKRRACELARIAPFPPRGQRREHISQICSLIPISPAVPDFQ